MTNVAVGRLGIGQDPLFDPRQCLGVGGHQHAAQHAVETGPKIVSRAFGQLSKKTVILAPLVFVVPVWEFGPFWTIVRFSSAPDGTCMGWSVAVETRIPSPFALASSLASWTVLPA